MSKALLSLSLMCTVLAGAQTYQANWDSLDRRPIPAWFTDAKFGIFIHWGVYSVPAYAPVIPGKLAYAEWYWHAITEGQKPNAGPVDVGSWEMHKTLYGADYPYANFSPQFHAEPFDPAHWADVLQRSGARHVALPPNTMRASRLAEQRRVPDMGTAVELLALEQGPHRAICSATPSPTQCVPRV